MQAHCQNSEPFHIAVGRGTESDSLILAGSFDQQSATCLKGAVLELAEGSGDIELDWGGVENMSAGALQVLLALGAQAARDGRAIRVLRDRGEIRRTLETGGLSERLPAANPAAAGDD